MDKQISLVDKSASAEAKKLEHLAWDSMHGSPSAYEQRDPEKFKAARQATAVTAALELADYAQAILNSPNKEYREAVNKNLAALWAADQNQPQMAFQNRDGRDLLSVRGMDTEKLGDIQSFTADGRVGVGYDDILAPVVNQFPKREQPNLPPFLEMTTYVEEK